MSIKCVQNQYNCCWHEGCCLRSNRAPPDWREHYTSVFISRVECSCVHYVELIALTGAWSDSYMLSTLAFSAAVLTRWNIGASALQKISVLSVSSLQLVIRGSWTQNTQSSHFYNEMLSWFFKLNLYCQRFLSFSRLKKSLVIHPVPNPLTRTLPH